MWLRRGGKAKEISHAECAEDAEPWAQRHPWDIRGISAIRVRPSHPRRGGGPALSALPFASFFALKKLHGMEVRERGKPGVPAEHRGAFHRFVKYAALSRGSA